MTSSAWPAHLIPKRNPPLWLALALTVGGMALAMGARAAILGPESTLGRSATYFPIFVLVTLYAGPIWGWLCLVAPIALGALLGWGVFARAPLTDPLTLMYLSSGAATIVVTMILRKAVLDLDEARTRQRTVEGALAQTVAHLQLAQEAGDVGLYELDLVNRKWTWSPALYRNMGVSPDVEPSWKVLLSVVHPDDRHIVAQLNTQPMRRVGRLPTMEYRVVWPDGSVHWLMSRGEIVADESGRLVRAVGVNMDVTERRATFDQLAESEARFRMMADSAPVLMWVSRANGAREFVNRAYVDYLGADYETAVAHDWRESLHPDDHDRILKEQLAGERSRRLFSLEARYRRADGAFRWIRSISQPRFGPAGELAGFVGVGIDITEAKNAEENLQRINDLLAERIQAALADRDKAESALHRAQKLEAVGQLTGGVAHDFNNLLTVITGALDLMQRHPDDAARRDRMVEAALAAARRGERLTHQLLTFARRQNLNPQVVRLDDLLRESEPLLRRAVGEAVDMALSPGAGEATARVDPSQFEAALMNLVVNARDAVQAGGAIRVESRSVRLGEGEVEETPGGDYICLAVHDTGVGMDEKTIARAFEPFFTTKEVGKGTGLGLSQIYGFARQSGGGVAIDSAPGKGASVSIYLPLLTEAAAAGAAQPPQAQAQAAGGPTLEVLLVEDDAAVGDMIEAMLEDAGHHVRRADDASKALDILKTAGRLDLMVTDVVMPGTMTGVDLAHQAVAIRPALPIILSSGYTGDTLKSATDSPWPLLRKPYSSEDLSRTIDKVLEPSGAAP